MGEAYLSALGMLTTGIATIWTGEQASCLLFFYLSWIILSSFVDRDMLMRFHWGLAVGHVYTHQQPCANGSVVWGNSGQDLQSRNGPEDPEVSRMDEDIIGSGTDGSGSESDDDDYESSEEGEEDNDDDDDERWLDINEMYGSDGDN